MRKGSVSANAAELADALKAPVSVRLIVCDQPPLAACIANSIHRFFALFGT